MVHIQLRWVKLVKYIFGAVSKSSLGYNAFKIIQALLNCKLGELKEQGSCILIQLVINIHSKSLHGIKKPAPKTEAILGKCHTLPTENLKIVIF